MKKLSDVKVGDIVYRYVGQPPQKFMELKVTNVTNRLIVCGGWEFSRANGAEMDEYLGWSEKSTGSFILPEIK